MLFVYREINTHTKKAFSSRYICCSPRNIMCNMFIFLWLTLKGWGGNDDILSKKRRKNAYECKLYMSTWIACKEEQKEVNTTPSWFHLLSHSYAKLLVWAMGILAYFSPLISKAFFFWVTHWSHLGGLRKRCTIPVSHSDKWYGIQGLICE